MASRPAWQTDDLAEEWIEPDEDETEQVGAGRGGSATGTYNFGTFNFNIAPSAERKLSQVQDGDGVGTFLVREELPVADLPKTPGKSKGGIKDMFAPLQLERMFEPPSPPKTSPPASMTMPAATPVPPVPPPSVLRMTQQRMSSRPAVPSKLSQVVKAASIDGDDDEDKENYRKVRRGEEVRPEEDERNPFAPRNDNVAADCRFTFTVPRPKPNPVPAGRHVSKSFTSYNPQAQSTPTPLNLQTQHNINDSRLRLFQFQYDTYTRDHLSAIVDSFGVSSPSSCSTAKSTMSTILPPLGSPTTPVEDDKDDRDSFSRLRAAKRLKLTPPTELAEEQYEAQQPPGRQRSPRKDYVGESKTFMEQIKRARLMSTASMLTNSDPAARTVSQTSSIPSSSGSNTGPTQAPSLSSTASGSQGKQTSLAFRQKAQDLMAKIKSDRQLFSEKSERSFNSLSSEDDQGDSRDRSLAPSPESRPRSPVKKALLLLPDSGPPSYAASVARPQAQGLKTTDLNAIFGNNGKIGSLKPNAEQGRTQSQAPNIFVMPLAIPESMSQMDRIRSPNPTFLAPPAIPFSNMRFSAQPRTDSINEDLNRLVSSGSTATTATTATTLTAGSTGLGVKQAGPAHMVRIGPGDLPSLPDRVGGMMFDHGLKRWIKERSNSTRTPTRPTIQPVPSQTNGSNESEDPFRDIESLHDEESNRSIPHSAVEQAILEFQEHQSDHSTGTEDMVIVESDTDSDFDDEEDAQLSTFTFDTPAAGVVQVMTGETESEDELDNNEPARSDSGSESDTISRVNGVNKKTDKEMDENLAKFADMSIVDAGRPKLNSPSPEPIETISALRKPTAFGTPHPSAKRGPQVPRSVLKSASVTPVSRVAHPRSVSFSDGRKDGKILDIEESREEPEEVISVAPSLRSKRINFMLEDLEESSFDEDSPSKDSQRAFRRPQIEPMSAEALGLQSPTSKAVFKRTLSRSPTIRSSPRRTSTAGNTPARNAANATFLTECSFGVAHDRLVEVITDVQPYEPYWEALSSVDLSSRKLESVARLKEFLPKLDSLNLTNNNLAWLSGIPSTVRTMSVASNALTNLTSFGHLQNLENLDISYNEIESLQQLGCLRHLRELRADGNRIKSLDGLALLDGLLKASFQKNELRDVNFSAFRWNRLELLNCSDNRIESVRGLGSLQAVVSLNLDNNALCALDRPSENSEASASDGAVLYRLRILRLSGNKLKQLDVARFPNLRMLYVDNNCLAESKSIQRSPKKTRPKLLNMHRLTKLENFSARNQACAGCRDSGLTLESDEVRDVKRLYLSGNPSPLPLGPSSQACYNLVYLELAACRITSLPDDFSTIMPNIRALNLNYNFVETDEVARGLIGLKRLRKLTIVGNRMAGTKGLIKMLSAMGQNVEMLDFRMNPCTLGWYLPLLVHDTNALLQPSEAPKTRNHTLLPSLQSQSALQRSENQAASGPEEATRKIDAVPSAAATDHISGVAGDALVNQATAKHREAAGPSYWEALDAQFRRGLPDKAYAGRLAYRGLVMRACPDIKILDGVRVTEKERRKAEALLRSVLKEAEKNAVGCANEQQ